MCNAYVHVCVCSGNNIVALPVEMSRPFKMNKEPSDKKFVPTLHVPVDMYI